MNILQMPPTYKQNRWHNKVLDTTAALPTWTREQKLSRVQLSAGMHSGHTSKFHWHVPCDTIHRLLFPPLFFFCFIKWSWHLHFICSHEKIPRSNSPSWETNLSSCSNDATVVGNCVGRSNHVFFATFLVACQAACGIMLGGVVWRLRNCNFPRWEPVETEVIRSESRDANLVEKGLSAMRYQDRNREICCFLRA